MGQGQKRDTRTEIGDIVTPQIGIRITNVQSAMSYVTNVKRKATSREHADLTRKTITN